MLLIIGHDAIPHHHSDMDKNDTDTGLSYDHKRNDDAKDHHEKQGTSPLHQHILAPANLIAVRINGPFQKENKFSVTIFISSLPVNAKFTSFDYQYFRIIKIPHNPFPFIISPNAIRGSPCIA
jgi:hypothetical protein